LQLAEAGKLGLDDSGGKYVTDATDNQDVFHKGTLVKIKGRS